MSLQNVSNPVSEYDSWHEFDQLTIERLLARVPSRRRIEFPRWISNALISQYSDLPLLPLPPLHGDDEIRHLANENPPCDALIDWQDLIEKAAVVSAPGMSSSGLFLNPIRITESLRRNEGVSRGVVVLDSLASQPTAAQDFALCAFREDGWSVVNAGGSIYYRDVRPTDLFMLAVLTCRLFVPQTGRIVVGTHRSALAESIWQLLSRNPDQKLSLLGFIGAFEPDMVDLAGAFPDQCDFIDLEFDCKAAGPTPRWPPQEATSNKSVVVPG